ncbi:hypothetical protein DZC31_04825 [Stenotrophomonas rhizophila]|nr:hypothetical protein DZC31_04825 [Stenotrophomonas rhizophila]
MSGTCAGPFAGKPAKRPEQTPQIQQTIALSRQKAAGQLFQRLQRINALFFLAIFAKTPVINAGQMPPQMGTFTATETSIPCNPLRLGASVISFFGPDGVRLMA